LAFLKYLELLHEALIGFCDYSFGSNKRKSVINTPAPVFHQISDYDSYTSGDPGVAMHENIGELPMFVDKSQALFEVVQNLIAFFVVRLYFKVERNGDRIIADG